MAFVRCGSTGRSRGGGVRGLLLAAGGSGDQYELVVPVTLSVSATTPSGTGAAFLAVDTLRLLDLVMPFCTRLVVVDGFMAGVPSRADRRRDIIIPHAVQLESFDL